MIPNICPTVAAWEEQDSTTLHMIRLSLHWQACKKQNPHTQNLLTTHL